MTSSSKKSKEIRKEQEREAKQREEEDHIPHD
jgi:hypothetical protein